MPNGGCLKCHKPIFQGLKPHYCEKCLAELGLTYEHLNDLSKVIRFYHKGEPYYEFTNFAPFPIDLDGKSWPTSEHYFQSQKHAGSSLEEEIRRAVEPREAFNLGRSKEISGKEFTKASRIFLVLAKTKVKAFGKL
jgi:predicted NAD-dependent protein-ADP-ribosyltransferase YbiA (DUF1768 family)